MLTSPSLNNRSTSWSRKQLQKAKQKAISAHEASLKASTREAHLQKIERRNEQEKRRKENEFKALTKQTMNVHKIGDKLKTMSKKQLRQIKKVRVDEKTGAKELVSPWKKWGGGREGERGVHQKGGVFVCVCVFFQNIYRILTITRTGFISW